MVTTLPLSTVKVDVVAGKARTRARQHWAVVVKTDVLECDIVAACTVMHSQVRVHLVVAVSANKLNLAWGVGQRVEADQEVPADRTCIAARARWAIGPIDGATGRVLH